MPLAAVCGWGTGTGTGQKPSAQGRGNKIPEQRAGTQEQNLFLFLVVTLISAARGTMRLHVLGGSASAAPQKGPAAAGWGENETPGCVSQAEHSTSELAHRQGRVFSRGKGPFPKQGLESQCWTDFLPQRAKKTAMGKTKAGKMLLALARNHAVPLQVSETVVWWQPSQPSLPRAPLWQPRKPLLPQAAQPLWVTPAVASSDTWEWGVPVPERTLSCCTCAESPNCSAFASGFTLSTIHSLSHAQGALTSAGTWRKKHFGKRQSRHSSGRHFHRRMLCSSKTKLGQRNLQQLYLLFTFIIIATSWKLGTAITACALFLSQLKSKTGAGLGLKTSQASTYPLQKQSPNLSWLRGRQMTARTKPCPGPLGLHPSVHTFSLYKIPARALKAKCYSKCQIMGKQAANPDIHLCSAPSNRLLRFIFLTGFLEIKTNALQAQENNPERKAMEKNNHLNP